MYTHIANTYAFHQYGALSYFSSVTTVNTTLILTLILTPNLKVTLTPPAPYRVRLQNSCYLLLACYLTSDN